MRVRPDEWRTQGIPDIEQNAWVALRETAHSICVTAGAGAGKTEFLAQKAAYLLQTGLCPAYRRILAISFKRDAATNLGLRVRERCAPEQSHRFDSMTFDAFTKSLLDRFRAAVPAPYTPPANYKIVFPGQGDYNQFLRGVRTDLNARQLEELIARVPLPIGAAEPAEHRKQALIDYWKAQYKSTEVPLSFPMINRIVEYMLRTNPQIRKALLLTYPHVFLDEFQDTTVAQFHLLRTAFTGGNTRFTAVGDAKQRIMGWADAMPNSFDVFTRDFNAKSVSLFLNWRSHEALVAVQRVVAERIDSNAPLVEARGVKAVDGDVTAIWELDTRHHECETLAAWLRQEADSGLVEPHDMAILVRMRANEVEQELSPALAAEGLVLRNLARNIGAISIQDLLCEGLTSILLPLLRLAASNRDPDAWANAQSGLQYVFALSETDELGQQRLQEQLQEFSRDLRGYWQASPPDAATAQESIKRATEFVGFEVLRQAFPEYSRDADFDRVLEGFRLLLVECAEAETTWSKVLDRFEGRNQVPLMTVHKSKGLEFHTMIFFGLDNRTWRSLDRDDAEELNAFFVAFTRARQRAFFTSCAQRGNAIGWIEKLLVPAGVQRVSGGDIN